MSINNVKSAGERRLHRDAVQQPQQQQHQRRVIGRRKEEVGARKECRSSERLFVRASLPFPFLCLTVQGERRKEREREGEEGRRAKRERT